MIVTLAIQRQTSKIQQKKKKKMKKKRIRKEAGKLNYIIKQTRIDQYK